MFHAKNKLPNGSSIILTSSSADAVGPGVPACPKLNVSSHELTDRAGELYYCRGHLDFMSVQRLRADTRFSLFLRGDDEGGDRLVNALAALQAPLMVGARPNLGYSSMDWLPFQSIINWSSLVVPVDYGRFMADPTAALEDVMTRHDADEGAELERQLATVRSFPDFLWSVPGSRVHENVLFEAYRHAPRCHAATHKTKKGPK